MMSESVAKGHEWKLITDLDNRKIMQACSCGWQKEIRLLDGVDSKYSDANSWASHFDFEAAAFSAHTYLDALVYQSAIVVFDYALTTGR